MNPDRFGPEEVAKAKLKLRAFGYAAQHQQRPVPKGGGMIKLEWFKRFKAKQIAYSRIIQSWDTANKKNPRSAFSVGLTFGEREDGGTDLIDVVREQWEYPALKAAVSSYAGKYRPHAILIENKASGIQLLQDMQAERKWGVLPIEPHGDKLTRMSVESSYIEAGGMALPHSDCADEYPWLFDLEYELSSLPLAAFMDQTDALSQYLTWRRSGGMFVGNVSGV